MISAKRNIIARVPARVPEPTSHDKSVSGTKQEEPNRDQSEKQNANKRPVKEYLSDCDESELDVDSGILAESRPSPINSIENPMDPPISGVSVRDMGGGVINLEVPNGLPVPGDSDDENDESKFTLTDLRFQIDVFDKLNSKNSKHDK